MCPTDQESDEYCPGADMYTCHILLSVTLYVHANEPSNIIKPSGMVTAKSAWERHAGIAKGSLASLL